MPASAIWARHERPEDLVERLGSPDSSVKLKALRDVKNQIIGNKAKKLSYIKLGAVPRIVEILANASDVTLLVQSAAAIGSFACRNEIGVRAVLEHGVLPHLLRALSNSNAKVVEACARSLKIIFQSSLAPRQEICDDNTIHFLTALISSDNENVSEVAANLLARSCEVKETQTSEGMQSSIQSLLGLLEKTTRQKLAALDALISITKENERNSMFIINLNEGYWFDTIFQLTKDKNSLVRLLACLCCIHIIEFKSNSSILKKSILSTSIKLLREPDQVGEESPLIIKKLVTGNEEFQNLSKGDAIIELVSILQKYKKSLNSISAKHLHAVLSCLAAICSLSEANRVHLADLQVLDYFISLLGNENDDVRASACHCILSLSRSTKVFKLHFKSDVILSQILTLLSNSSSPKLQLVACEVMCNLVLNFNFENNSKNEMKVPTEQDNMQCFCIISELCKLSQSMDHDLKSAAVVALKNYFFFSNLEKKSFFVSKMSLSNFKELLMSDDVTLQGHALGLLQNLFFGTSEEMDFILSYSSEFIFPFFHFILTSKQLPVSHFIQVFYCLSNIASGNEKHKRLILSFFFSSPLNEDVKLSDDFFKSTNFYFHQNSTLNPIKESGNFELNMRSRHQSFAGMRTALEVETGRSNNDSLHGNDNPLQEVDKSKSLGDDALHQDGETENSIESSGVGEHSSSRITHDVRGYLDENGVYCGNEDENECSKGREYYANALIHAPTSSSLAFRCIENSPNKRLKRFPANLLVLFMHDSRSEDLRLAALMCIVNLTWPNSLGLSQIISTLTGHGIDVALELLIHDSSLHVQNLAKRSLEHLIISDLL